MKVDLNNTLEQLDKQDWGEPEYDSYLVKTCHQLRKKTLKDFTIEDLRIMIGQNINLEFLIPLAIEKLKEDILAEGNYYEGDLLNNVLNSEKQYWLSNKTNWQTVCKLFDQNIIRLKEFDTTNEIKSTWFENFKIFTELNP
ncbi:MAG: contact-dependent growth inhibition system immunity protein [Ferruginibacter sp.]|nr:hypothetical protein [Chitinophagaceae bacterium]